MLPLLRVETSRHTAGARFRERKQSTGGPGTLRPYDLLSFLNPVSYHVERPCKSAKLNNIAIPCKIQNLSGKGVPTAVSSGANCMGLCSLDFSRTTSLSRM